MAYSGPFQPGDRVQLTDPKRRHLTITLQPDAKLSTHKGIINHNDIIGADEGTIVKSEQGTEYLCFRHLLVDHILSMPRGAAVIYPKDSAQILTEGDIFPGARVLEAGPDHLEYAENNVDQYFGTRPPNWDPRLGDLRATTLDDLDGQPVDRVLLDMLEPWECLTVAKQLLVPGGVLMAYVATVPQLMNVMEGIREQQCFTEPRAWESLVREWRVEGLATRPEHRMNAHTAFLIWARRLADGVTPPRPQRRARK